MGDRDLCCHETSVRTFTLPLLRAWRGQCLRGVAKVSVKGLTTPCLPFWMSNVARKVEEGDEEVKERSE